MSKEAITRHHKLLKINEAKTKQKLKAEPIVYRELTVRCYGFCLFVFKPLVYNSPGMKRKTKICDTESELGGWHCDMCPAFSSSLCDVSRHSSGSKHTGVGADRLDITKHQ